MKHTLKKTFTYLRTHLVRTLLVIFGIIVGIVIIDQVHIYNHPYDLVDYKVFAPEGRRLEGARLNITAQHGYLPRTKVDAKLSPSTSVNYYFFEKDVYMLADIEKIDGNNSYYANKCSNLGNEPNVSSWFCEVRTSPKGQKYVHDGWVGHDGEDASYHEGITLAKEGSYITIDNKSFGRDTYKTTNWDALVDSLKELKPSAETLPIFRRGPNPLS